MKGEGECVVAETEARLDVLWNPDEGAECEDEVAELRGGWG